jgi:mevalonate kinase
MTNTTHWTKFAEIAIAITPGVPAFARVADTLALTLQTSAGCGCGSSASVPASVANTFLRLGSKL